MREPEAEPPVFYATGGLNEATYDQRTRLEATPVEGDVAFYVRLARECGGPVLELASGTGRVAWELARAGVPVTGLELSPGMLARAEAKRAVVPAEAGARATFVQGDMTAFDLPGRFALVLVPFRAFQALLEPNDQRRCLRCVHRHLEPGGRLVVDLFDPRLDLCFPGAQGAMEREEAVHPETGNPVQVEILSRTNDPLRQRFSERWRFSEVDAGGHPLRVEEEVLELRWTYRYEMRYLLELCGFVVEAEYGDFQGGGPAYGREQVWVATRPG
jgi:SAM-dependent methyltransferase